MNKSLIIIAVSAILVLLLILKFVVRDNINSGDDAVYGPKGTDDLPVDPMANLKDTYQRSVLKNTKKIKKIKKARNDATNCSGWDCSVEGQFCPKGTVGAKDGNYICTNKKWVKINSDTVETFENINEMYPGYSEYNYAEFQN